MPSTSDRRPWGRRLPKALAIAGRSTSMFLAPMKLGLACLHIASIVDHIGRVSKAFGAENGCRRKSSRHGPHRMLKVLAIPVAKPLPTSKSPQVRLRETACSAVEIFDSLPRSDAHLLERRYLDHQPAQVRVGNCTSKWIAEAWCTQMGPLQWWSIIK